ELAIVQGHLGKLEEALNAAERAVSLCPNHPKYHNAVAGIQLDLARRCKTRTDANSYLARALQYKDRLIREFPNYPPAHLGRAAILAASGAKEADWEAEIDEACKLYEQQSVMGAGIETSSERLKIVLQNCRMKCLEAAAWWQKLP
ncbi:MAG: hypothetical protein WCL37_06195, partial [Chrysiogenales bacterium]